MSKISLISIYSNQICVAAGFTSRVKRSKVDAILCNVLRIAKEDGILTASEWSGLDAVWYGINWYIQTGRATVEIESELKALTGLQLIRLVVKIWLDGCNTPGDAGDWLRKWQGGYARMIK